MIENSLNEELATELRVKANNTENQRAREFLQKQADALHRPECEALANIANFRAFFRIDAGTFQ